ncbi:hypothetical protein GGX14DRAFT_577565 [Mycena pura]|uniref:RING-type domain-containing protein n=1 Tax=Mycena pura TaxID=153505 RepID=A0AAD6URD3_9AGAR|nr:hypothetical protein GGX14DRAFT_577565 [Mycena pura]
MGVHYHSQLDTLERYFKALPASLLESTADSSELEPSTTEVENYGSVTSAFNLRLEPTLRDLLSDKPLDLAASASSSAAKKDQGPRKRKIIEIVDDMDAKLPSTLAAPNMLFNSSLATTIALLASAGLAAAAAAADAPNDQRLRRLGRVAPRQNDCASDADCSGGVCCSGIAFGPGEGAGLSALKDSLDDGLSPPSTPICVPAVVAGEELWGTEGLFEPPATAALEHFLDERQRRVDPIRRELERLRNVERRRAQAQQERERLHAAANRECALCRRDCHICVNPWQSTLIDRKVAQLSDDSDDEEEQKPGPKLHGILLTSCGHVFCGPCLAQAIYISLNVAFDPADYGTVLNGAHPRTLGTGKRADFPVTCPQCRGNSVAPEISDSTARRVLGEENTNEWNLAQKLFHGGASQDHLPSAAGVVPGVFDIAEPIYDDAARPFSIDADVVLEGLLWCTHAGASCRVVPVEAADSAAGSRYASGARTPCALRVYELRTPSGYVFRRVGTRRGFPVPAPDNSLAMSRGRRSPPGIEDTTESM